MKRTLIILSMLLLTLMTYGQAQLHEIFYQASQDYKEYGRVLKSIDKERGLSYTRHFEIPRFVVSNDFIVKIRNVYIDAMSTADESNHYEKHGKDGSELISYSIVNEGMLMDKNSSCTFEMGQHRFDLGAKLAANLDIDGRSVVLTLSERTAVVKCQPVDPSPLDKFLSALKGRKGVTTHDVSYRRRNEGTAIFSLVNNAQDTTYVTTGVRYDFADEATDVKEEFERIIMSYIDRKQECLISKDERESYELGMALGFYNYVYVAAINKQGKLQILQVRRHGPNMFVPVEWPDITYYNNGQMR